MFLSAQYIKITICTIIKNLTTTRIRNFFHYFNYQNPTRFLCRNVGTLFTVSSEQIDTISNIILIATIFAIFVFFFFYKSIIKYKKNLFVTTKTM